MDRKLQRQLKTLYYKKLRAVHVYGAQSRKVRDLKISGILSSLSCDEYNHLKSINNFLLNSNIRPSFILKILVQSDSFWSGYFSYFLGKKLMTKYNMHREKSFLKFAAKLKIKIPDITFLYEIEESAQNHLSILEEL